MRQSFTPSFIRLTPEPFTRSYALAWVALAAIGCALLLVRVSDPLLFASAAICVQLGAAMAVARVWAWRVPAQLAIGSDGALYLLERAAFVAADLRPASVFAGRWCYLQIRTSTHTWHAVLAARRNRAAWRHFQVLRRWCKHH